jgi:hypothetical protein
MGFARFLLSLAIAAESLVGLYFLGYFGLYMIAVGRLVGVIIALFIGLFMLYALIIFPIKAIKGIYTNEHGFALSLSLLILIPCLIPRFDFMLFSIFIFNLLLIAASVDRSAKQPIDDAPSSDTQISPNSTAEVADPKP